MEALNSQTPLDEFQLDNFQGGLECNIEEVSIYIFCYSYFKCNYFGALIVRAFPWCDIAIFYI